MRNSKIKCPALVQQKGSKFVPNLKKHTHVPKYGAKEAALVAKRTKLEACKKPFVSATQILRSALQEEIPNTASCEALPPIDCMTRNINYFRQKHRPQEPKRQEKDFDLSYTHLPSDFLLEDISIEGERHILFATTIQLRLLESAKTWFVDGTFKLMRKPFVQLFSIHAFVRKDGEAIQLSLLFCLMTRRQKIDYVAILEAITTSFSSDNKLERVILDFEAALWRAFETVFPQAKLTGCSFHFTQAIFRHVQMLGLQTSYQNNIATRKYIRKLMALCYIPDVHIKPLFEDLAMLATCEPLKNLIAYINNTWITSLLHGPHRWSVFGMPIRTNNDVEGWHNKLNKKVNHKSPFYLLVTALHNEASQIPINIELLEMKCLKRHQRKKICSSS